jgi:hypothetical protein
MVWRDESPSLEHDISCVCDVCYEQRALRGDQTGRHPHVHELSIYRDRRWGRRKRYTAILDRRRRLPSTGSIGS